MLDQDQTPAAASFTLDDQDAAAIAQFCQAIGAYARGMAEMDGAAARAGVEAMGRVAVSAQMGGSGFGFSSWQARLVETPDAGHSLLTIEGEGQQLTLTLDSTGHCAGGVWIQESEELGPGAALFTVLGGVLHLDRAVQASVDLAGPVSGWTEAPAAPDEAPEGSLPVWGAGAVMAGVGAGAALAGAAVAAQRQREARAATAARLAAEKAAAEKAAAEKAAAEKAAAELAAAELAAATAPAPSKQWFYTKAGQPVGPVPESELVAMLATLPASTLVWNADLPDWKPVSQSGLAPAAPGPVLVPPPPPPPPLAMTAAPDTWELAVISGPASGKYFAVSSHMKLGRAIDCDVCLLDPMASRVHALITKGPDGYWLSDNNSSNGTSHNGSIISGPVKLAPGDVVQVGDSEMTFQAATHEPSPVGSPVMTTVVIPPSEPVAPRPEPIPFPAPAPAPIPVPAPAPAPGPVFSAPAPSAPSGGSPFGSAAATLGPVCPRCHATGKPGDRFCESCGMRL